MKPALLATALAALTSTAVADVSITDNAVTLAIDCAADPTVTVMGNHATVTLTGTCAKVTVAGNHATVTGSATSILVAGNHNRVDAIAVDKLLVPGNHNVVTYKTAVTAKQRPKVSVPGRFNKVSRAK